MGSGFPLGTFSRGRRDWSIRGMMLGSIYYGGNGGNAPRFSLNNDSSTGSYLGVYGILAWRATRPRTMTAVQGKGSDPAPAPSNNAVIGPIIANAPVINGVLGFQSGSFGGTTQGLTFIGDGKTWLTMGDMPLFVIPPGYQVVVTGTNPSTTQPPQWEPFTCAFIWGKYSDGSLPKVKTPGIDA